MAYYLRYSQETTLTIPQVCEVEGVNYYEILMKVHNVQWSVKKRFKEFEKLHETLVGMQIGFNKDLLPPKKIIGAKSPTFLNKRREALEKYLNETFRFLQVIMPKEFVEFLDFHKFDIVYVLQTMAASFFQYGESYLLKSGGSYTFSMLELHCISERIKLPCAPSEVSDQKYDFSHVLDFCAALDAVTVVPVKSSFFGGGSFEDSSEVYDRQVRTTLHRPIGTSNLVPAQLPFEMGAFKSLRRLTLLGVPPENMVSVGSLRDTLESFTVQKTDATELAQILICDAPIHRNVNEVVEPANVWKRVTRADFSDNQLRSIDKSVNLLPQVRELVLDKNLIEAVANLRSLPQLASLSLEANRIACCENLHLQLGNLVSLNLCQNLITRLGGFHKMLSIVSLDLSCNMVERVEEVDHIGHLPLLENLKLTGNPVASTVDYRARVLSRFGGERMQDMLLDNEKGTQAELDTALVLSALRISAGGKEEGR